jgi:putative endonuclease
VDESRTAALGRYGEQLAAEHLTAAGMTVLARNWRCAQGELDLVLRDTDGTVVFCEVKTGRAPATASRRRRSGTARPARCGSWPAGGSPSTARPAEATCASTS